MTDFLIDVIVDPSKAAPALDKVDNRLRRLEKSGKRLQNTLRRAITLVGITAAARQLGVFADSLTNVQNRLRLVTKDSAQLNAVTKKLFDIAARTRTGFAATATIFSRTALAVKDLGLSLQETLDFTEALNQAIVLSGVKAQEANAGLIQLSQGLASGTLRGDELRSVLEQLPKVADLIADKLGVDRGELRLLGEQGLITTKQIIKAFTGLAAADLTKAFAESIPTMSQGFSVLTTRIIQYVGEADEALKISEAVARALITLSVHLDTVGKAAIVAGAALVGPFAKAGVLFATRAVLALTAAIAANPFGAIVVLALSAAAAIDQFGDNLIVSEDGLLSLKDVAIATWDAIVEGIQPAVDFITEGFKEAINFVIDAFSTLNLTFSDVGGFLKTFVNGAINHIAGMARAFKSILSGVGDIFKSVLGEDLTELISKSTTFVKGSLKSIGEFAGTVAEKFREITGQVKDIIGDIDVDPKDKSFLGNMFDLGENAAAAYKNGLGQDFVGDLIGDFAPTLRKIETAARKISDTRRKPANGGGAEDLTQQGVRSERPSFAFRQTVVLLGEEAKALSATSREREVLNRLLEVTEKLRKANSAATPEQEAVLKALIDYNVSLEEQADLLEEINGPQDALIRKQELLGTLFENSKISLQQFNNEMKLLALTQAEINAESGTGNFVDGFITGIGTMLESVRSFATEAGLLFADFFTMSTEGFSQAVAGAIVFGDSLTEALGNAARSAIASLLSGLIDVGVQFLLNSLLSDTLKAKLVAGSAATATAEATAQAVKTTAAVASIGTITAAMLASNVAIATSAAAPAALVSLATAGTNAIPATAGILSTTIAAETVAATAFLADGGFVSGPGGPTSDSIPARLSDGEFVVNAKSTARFRPQLEAMNNGSGQEIFDNSSQSQSQSGSANSEAGGANVNVINLLDPGIVEDFLDSPNGEQTIINVIERNAGAVSQIVGDA